MCPSRSRARDSVAAGETSAALRIRPVAKNDRECFWLPRQTYAPPPVPPPVTGHPWDTPFFLAVSALQYCRLAWPLGMALVTGVMFLICMSCFALYVQGWSAVGTVLSVRSCWAE